MLKGERPPQKFQYDFPLRENCDPGNPYEFALWTLVALPGQNGGQLILPVEYLQMVSKRQWDCGLRQVEEPVIKYHKPSTTTPHWMTSPGSWVDINAPDPDPRPPARKAADSLTNQQKTELYRELHKDFTPRERFEMMQAEMQAEIDQALQRESGDDVP